MCLARDLLCFLAPVHLFSQSGIAFNDAKMIHPDSFEIIIAILPTH
jgi:hypothetical protein